jgi:hypothetical protein
MQAGKRRAAGLIVLSMGLVLVMAPVAGGQEEVAIEIPFETVIRAEPGSVHLLATAQVPPELQGVTCPVAAVAENESSVHPGNNLIVATDGDSIVLEDVERAAGAVTVAEEELTFGSTITVTLVLGEDGVFSAGMTVKFCDIPETTTTTTTVETTTTTTEATTTTTTIPTTTTTMETTTTVTVLPSTTVTTAPEATTTVTVAPSSTSTVPETLPFTGGETDTTALVALVALLAGAGLVALTREEADS